MEKHKYSLYELTAEYEALLGFMEDPDVDQQALEDTLEGLSGEIEDKADGYGRVIKQVEADRDAIAVEIARLMYRKQNLDKKLDSMKEHLKQAMILMDKRKIDTGLFRFSVRKNPDRVVLDEKDVYKIPEQYLKYKEPDVDRVAIKEDLKAGKDLGGIAHLEQTESLRMA